MRNQRVIRTLTVVKASLTFEHIGECGVSSYDRLVEGSVRRDEDIQIGGISRNAGDWTGDPIDGPGNHPNPDSGFSCDFADRI